ncbi:MAG: metallophosphoesterase family protein [Acidilobaceae archaeon]
MLHLSDAHCESSNLLKALRRESFDFVIYTGDFECVDVAELLLEEGGEVYAVTGELDNPAIYRVLKKRGSLLDGVQKEIRDIAIIGVGGLETINNIMSPRDVFMRERSETLVLASHHPPLGVLDSSPYGISRGYLELALFSNSLKPVLHVFGHVHEDIGTLRRDKTLFVNAGSITLGYYAVITIVANSVHEVRTMRL